MAAEWIEKSLSLRCFGEAEGSTKPETPAGVGAANNKIEMEEGGADLSSATAMTPISLIETIRGAGIPHGTRLRPWLILGSAADAVDVRYLRKHGVTVVLSVADEVPVRPPAFVTYHCVPVKDYVSSGEYQRETLWRIHTIIDAVRRDHEASPKERPPVCLVHCMRGRSRSVTACLAHLVWHERMSLREAFDEVFALRPVIGPHRHLRRQLLAFEERELGSSSIPSLEAWGGKYGGSG